MACLWYSIIHTIVFPMLGFQLMITNERPVQTFPTNPLILLILWWSNTSSCNVLNSVLDLLGARAPGACLARLSKRRWNKCCSHSATSQVIKHIIPWWTGQTWGWWFPVNSHMTSESSKVWWKLGTYEIQGDRIHKIQIWGPMDISTFPPWFRLSMRRYALWEAQRIDTMLLQSDGISSTNVNSGIPYHVLTIYW